MLKIFRNRRFLLSLCIFSVLATCVPAAISIIQLIDLRKGIEDIERVSSISVQSRNVLDIVAQSLPSFTAITLDLTSDELAEILAETDRHFAKLEGAVTELRSAGSGYISKQRETALADAIKSVAHSWEEIREQSGTTMVAAEQTYHFLKIFAEIGKAREILNSIEHDATTAADVATKASFDRVERTNVLIITALLGAALIGLIAIISNHQFARSMQRSNEHLDAALSNMSSGLCMFDGHQRLVVCNERFATMYGLTSELLKPGTTYRQILEHCISNDIFVSDTSEDHLQARLATVSERSPSTRIQQLYDGRFVEISHCPMSDGGWLATHDDITDLKTVEAVLVRHRDHLQELVNEATVELKTTAEQLKLALVKEKELNKLQRQFVSMASHEFRTPLAIIDSTAQRLKRRVDKLTPAETIERADKIRAAVQRMTRLMESTLAAARMEEGKIAVEIGACDLGRVLRELCTRQHEMDKTHTITCKLVDLPATIQADSAALEQVFTNLLSNAVKYAPDAPEIDVVARGEGDEVVISVRDRGLGIDEEDLPKMFERFFRAKTSTGIAGTGIGLNLVKTLVEMHGGSIAIKSNKGEGSTLTVRLPVDGPEKTKEPDSQAA